MVSRHQLKVAGISSVVLMAVVSLFIYRQWRYGSAHFAYSIGTTPDEMLPIVQDARPGVDLATTTPDDFPEFLGSHRRAGVDNVALDPNWEGSPPRLLWRQPIGAGWSAFAVVNGFAVTMEQRGKQEQVTCYNVASGQHNWTTAWEERFSVMGVGPRSTPTIAKGRVYALGAWGHLVCLDGSTGKVIWQRELLRDLEMHWSDENKSVRFGRANSPLVAGELVIVPGGGPRGKRFSLLAFSAESGEPCWRSGNRQISYSSPTLAKLFGEQQILSVNEDTVSGHSLDTGAELWSHPWPGDSSADANVSQAVPVSSNSVFVSAGYRRGAGVIELIRKFSGEPIRTKWAWRQKSVLNTKFSNIVLWNDHAYGLSEGLLECVDVKTGERRWKAGNYGQGQVLRVRDLLLVLTGTGQLVLVRLDAKAPNAVSGRLQALTGATYNNIALYGRHLLVRNATEAAYYELATVRAE